ncbi:MAG: 2-amino-4-hydroxy-6-hydroxymethyldihydropteridine diphosphokinase [Bacteroidetes bacterium]|nr:MAG: 2-amino-4-hydroxy-6-hydroxymethyldihydropteridine diphosphokinase [Bacteroidota bacterium]
MAVVYLSLGSNIGDRASYLAQAITEINDHVGKILRCSSVIETEPWGVSEPQDAYLNQSIAIETSLEPLPLLYATQAIEKKMGRTSKGERKPRTIDIDILYYDNEIINLPELIIPHPFAHLRDFVLITVGEIRG